VVAKRLPLLTKAGRLSLQCSALDVRWDQIVSSTTSALCELVTEYLEPLVQIESGPPGSAGAERRLPVSMRGGARRNLPALNGFLRSYDEYA